MKDVSKLKRDVSSIEEFAINSLIVYSVINLGINSKTPIMMGGYETGGFVEVDSEGMVWVLQNPSTKNGFLKDLPFAEIVNILSRLSERKTKI